MIRALVDFALNNRFVVLALAVNVIDLRRMLGNREEIPASEILKPEPEA